MLKLKTFIKNHTWQSEAFVVGVILASSVIVVSGNSFKEWLGAFAVFFSFMHAQVSDRMAEKQAAMIKPDVECWRWAQRYFITKECLWLTYFLLSQTYAALTGVFIFLLYPIWRKYFNRVKNNWGT